jgi:magnesium chelatase subunit ChlD-like protein
MAPKSLSHCGPAALSNGAGRQWQLPSTGGHAMPSGHGIAGPSIDWPHTLLAKGVSALQRQHLRHLHSTTRPARLHLLLIDTSGSMRRHGRLALAKGCADRLIAQAARDGDEAGVLCFGGAAPTWLQRPGPARRALALRVRTLGGGGGTPLADALANADASLRQRRRRSHGVGRIDTWLWLLTDGRSLQTPPRPTAADHIVFVDHDDPLVPAGQCRHWARQWGATWLPAPLPEPNFVSAPCPTT